MGRQAEISEQEVFAAIEGLLAQGAYPTSARIREAVGHRGSPVLLQKLLASWYARFGAAFSKKVAALKSADQGIGIRDTFATAAKEALATFDAEQARRLAEFKRQEDELAQREARFAEREVALAGWIEQLQATAEKAIADAQTAAIERTRLETELATLIRQQATMVERDRAQADELRRLAGLEVQSRHAREDLQRLRALVTEQLEQNKASQRQITTARLERDEAEQRATELRAELADTRVALSEAAARAKGEQAQVKLLAGQVEVLKSALEKLTPQGG